MINKEELNQEKLSIQLDLIESWKQADACGTIEASTGFGKTFVALLLIEEMNLRYPERTTGIIVPTLYLKGQWEKELSDHGLKNAEVLVINTAVKQPRFYNFLVLDEIHRYGADVFGTVFDKIKYDFLLGLTATMERQDKRHFYISNYCPVIERVPIGESLKKGYVSDFIVFNLGIDLSDKETEEYEKVTRAFNRYFSWFDHDFYKAMRCMKDQSYAQNFARSIGADEKFIQVTAINFFRTMQKRKTFLYDIESKKTKAVEIINKLNLNTIVFSENITSAESIKQMLGDKCVCYHSKMSKKAREKAINSFRDPDSAISVISTVRSLDEGLNVENVECAVTISGNSTSRQSIQRTGRAIRYIEDKKAIIVNIYVNGTQEFKWVQGRMSGMPRNVIHWITDPEKIIDELNNKIPGGKIDITGTGSDCGRTEEINERSV